MGVWRYIKRFINIYSSRFTGGHITYRISTGLTNGYGIAFQLRPKFGGTVDIHKMYLYILTGRDMQTPGGILLGNLAYPSQLLRSHFPIGQFHPDHLHPWLALPIDSPGQP